MSATAAKATPSVDFINPFIIGVAKTFQSMLSCQPVRGRLVPPDHGPHRDITALVSLTGPARGTVALRFPLPTANVVTGRILGERTSSYEATIEVVSDLLNVVAERAKAQFAEGVPIAIGLPSVIRGHGYQVEHKAAVHSIAVPFTSELGPFYLEVTLESAPEN